MRHLTFRLVLCLAMAPVAHANDRPPVPAIGPDQLAFSLENMDKASDPGTDFYRFALGGWIDRVERPADRAMVDAFDFMGRRLTAQMEETLLDAAAKSETAERGTPIQQVGAFYTSFMDVATLDAKGMTPLDPEMARIDAIVDLGDLASYLGHYLQMAEDLALAGFVPMTDMADSTRNSLYFAGASLVLGQQNLYEEPPGSALDLALRKNLADMLVAAGYEHSRATAVAALVADIDRELHGGMLTPVEAANPANTYQPVPFAALQAEIPELDLTALLAGLGMKPPERVIKSEPRYLPILGKVLRERPIEEIRDYLKVKLINRFKFYLGSRFEVVIADQQKILVGVEKLPPREERVQNELKLFLGHPVSQLYVERYFDDETRAKSADMVGRVKDAFLARIETRDWLTEATRAAAKDKLEKLTFEVGYPQTWIDMSEVEVRPDDLIGNIQRLIAFDVKRSLDKFDDPVEHESFANVQSTLPIIVNAAYDPSINGFEVPAAILQPPAFEADLDAPVYFCRLGAVLGHEMTHGFDSRGRQYDADGNLRDWWTPEDTVAFTREAEKLVAQANAYEVLPGLTLNGALTVTENMADVGGITLAYAALQDYLAENPEENVAIDGFSPGQRCFLAWAQFWGMKATDGVIRSVFMSDAHAPGMYRSIAALKHVDEFYSAFDITEGEPEWLAPEKRVRAW
ncbi:M13 family metallopeptidase [Rhizobium sp. AAP43]|uniref:M13 family metallopeptidase n=1 Tax=Rhizobium sp. AAP43 TaxID=1523420 RepID=UPI001FD8CBA5|nr:M13 family metallopeptidase [Rhizobium sp. AAP43]